LSANPVLRPSLGKRCNKENLQECEADWHGLLEH
jgi:hypothetical protein